MFFVGFLFGQFSDHPDVLTRLIGYTRSIPVDEHFFLVMFSFFCVSILWSLEAATSLELFFFLWRLEIAGCLHRLEEVFREVDPEIVVYT